MFVVVAFPVSEFDSGAEPCKFLLAIEILQIKSQSNADALHPSNIAVGQSGFF